MAMTRASLPAPSLEERLTSAAFTILTDDYHHSHAARVWATCFLRYASRGHPTAFQTRLIRSEARRRREH